MDNLILILIRHGQTLSNVQSGAPQEISKLGEEQINLLAERLRNTRSDRIISSKLERAILTAEGICPSVQHETSELLNEVNRRLVGKKGGHKPQSQSSQSSGGALDRRYRAIRSRIVRVFRRAVPPKWYIEDEQRMESLWQWIGSMNGNVIMVCHGNVIRNLVGKVLRLSKHQCGQLLCDNTSISIVERRNDKWTLMLLNDISHLPNSQISDRSSRKACLAC